MPSERCRSLLARVERAGAPSAAGQLDRLFPAAQRAAPLVTVLDGAPQTLSWLGSVYGVPVVPLGVDAFGQVGSVADLYRHFRIDADADAVVNAALVALSAPRPPAPGEASAPA